MKTLLVRIKEHDPRRGHVLRRYAYKGIRFQEGNGWYRVSEEVGDYLREVHQKAGDASSPRAFDVCTEKQAREVDKKEAREEQPKRPADNAREAVARDEGAAKDDPEGAAKKAATPTPKGAQKKG